MHVIVLTHKRKVTAVPGGRSRSEWERRMVAQRREAERQTKEQSRLVKEREKARKEAHLAAQQRSADMKTAATERQVKDLDEVLTSVLGIRPVNFANLMLPTVRSPFEPGTLALRNPEPAWTDFAPSEPRGLTRILGGNARYGREVADAQARFDIAMKAHMQAEADRQRALANAKATYDQQVAADQQRIAEIRTRQSEFAAGVPEAVEWFVSRVLDASRYPRGFPRTYQVAYRPENRDVVVEFELPPKQVVPEVRGYRYIKTRDEIEALPRPQNEIRQRYKRLIACVALRTLYEIFTATPSEVVEAVVFNGRLSTIDRATGKPIRPHLLSVSAERAVFADLVLAAVEPAACLTRLNALVSANPYDLEAVEPFIAFDLKRFRFTDDLDVVAGLDSRPNLLKLTPTEFEHLVKQLFVAMGAEAWTTIPSKDGGVDAVATSRHLFFGGVCLIQAKRWTGLVGLESVHALTGVMADHNATTGVLVTTSWFGRASEQFAQRNRITLINGAELKQLVKEYLHNDVIPGTSPPRRLRASDNVQTGRPGPARP
jgi:restriction system protein